MTFWDFLDRHWEEVVWLALFAMLIAAVAIEEYAPCLLT